MSANAQMVALARESAGLTQTSLAHSVNVSQGMISKIENGLEEPDEALVEAIAVSCDVPVEFIYRREQILGEGLVDFYHKKRLTLPAKPLRRANARSNVSRLEAVRLLRSIEFETLAPFPVLPIGEHESVEEVAAMVRAVWRISEGPISDLTAYIESAGVPTFVSDLEHEKLSAISMPGVNGRHVVIVNSMLPASARRFALAHELGHLVMHDGVASENMEQEADEFASALLMPAQQIIGQLRGLRFRDLGQLKVQWRVSLAALIRRAHDLGCITDRQYKTFNIELNKIPGGRKREPGEFREEKPRLVRHVIDHYKSILGYSDDELCRLMVVKADRYRRVHLGDSGSVVRSVGARRGPLQSVSLPSSVSEVDAGVDVDM